MKPANMNVPGPPNRVVPAIPDTAVEAFRRAHADALQARSPFADGQAIEVSLAAIRAGLAAAYPHLAAQALRAYADSAHPRYEGLARRTDYGTGEEYDAVCYGCSASWSLDDGGCTERIELLSAANALAALPACTCHETGAPCDCADALPAQPEEITHG